MSNRIELGDRVKDGLSGWEGIAAGRYEYLNGCVRIGIAGKDKDGAPEEYVFDEQQVVVVQKAAFVPFHMREDEAATRAPTGGPRSTTPPAR